MLEVELKKDGNRQYRVVKAENNPQEFIRRHELSLLKLIAERYPDDARKIFRDVIEQKLLTTT